MTLAIHSQPPSSSPLLWELRLTKASLQLPPTSPAPAGPLTPPPPSPDGTQILLSFLAPSVSTSFAVYFPSLFPSLAPSGLLCPDAVSALVCGAAGS